MQALVTTTELAERLPFVMDDDELREAEGALEDLSDDARTYGKSIWTEPNNTPAQVKRLILRAAARHMKNYEGYTQSRAGDETVAWTDRGEDAGSATFTRKEIETLRAMSGNQGAGFHTVPVFAHSNQAHTPNVNDLVRDESGFVLPLYKPGRGPL